ncbi:MAG: hypothetical protein MMC23_006310 [Stictis urceolatum]|nr:hypothetical protein [Stictis urceolata]
MPPIPTLNIPQGDTDTGPLLPIIDTHSLVSLREGLIRCNSDQYALKHVLVYQFQLSRWDIDTEPYFQGSLTLDGLRTTLLQTFREYFDSSLSELEAQNQSKQKMLEASAIARDALPSPQEQNVFESFSHAYSQRASYINLWLPLQKQYLLMLYTCATTDVFRGLTVSKKELQILNKDQEYCTASEVLLPPKPAEPAQSGFASL